ncbi:MAG: DNA-directed RNA polymerase subunit B [Candidatus Aenigmatarchaeota archaeon]
MAREEIIKSFIDSVGLVNHQINSFNEFIEYRFQKIIDEIGEIALEVPEIAEFKIKLGKLRLPKPSIKEADGASRSIAPMEARIRDLTYSSPIFVEMIPIINGVEQESQEVELGELPIMVRSKLCTLNGFTNEQFIEADEDPKDPGGYFIINGTERVLVLMEEVLPNRPIIEIKAGLETARINSEASGFVQRHILERRDGVITVSFANLKKLPAVVLLRALGIDNDEELINNISKKKDAMQEIFFNLYEFDVKTTEEAFEFIGKKLKIPQKEYRDKRVNDILDKYFLPHLGQTSKMRKEKAIYLSKVMRKLLKVSSENLADQDIDHYAYKRLKFVGDYFEILFRSLLLGKYGLVSRIVYSYQKLVKRGKMPAIKSIVESDYLTKRIISHMATGQWVGGRTGVCQRLERTNMIRTIAHLRNVISPLSSAQEHFEARALHPTQWGRLCCEETPEGINIGLRKYLALMSVISVNASEKDRELIAGIARKENPGDFTIFMDGRVVGTTNSADKFIEKIRDSRRKGDIDSHISAGKDDTFQEISINTDSGRLQRPLIVVENGKSLLKEKDIEKIKTGELTWDNLITQGSIEYLDADEEDNSLVALDERFLSNDMTHMEISPVVIMGLSASLVPFAPHNRGDRVNFGAKMSGQALGIFTDNFLIRTDTKSDVLIYPQTPLVSTSIGNMMQILQGQNLIMAIMSFKGYNMEDAIIINKASLERGLGRSMFFRNYTVEEKRYFGIERDEIKIPDKSVSGYKMEEAYKCLSPDGIINPEVSVKSGDVMVGKVSPLRFFGPSEQSFMVGVENRRETSETIRHGEEGMVDNVILTETVAGDKIVKVRVRQERVPELGDKFASRHGQKGVIGLIVNQEDMPFTADGIIPDIVVNPHAIPSRMTMGQLLEIIAGKLSSMTGIKVDASAFANSEPGKTEENIRKELIKIGCRDDGKEALYDGTTGKLLEGRILIGPIYFQKLHHMIANKIHARARGPVTLLTKQPTAGRSKQGGLRLGEMEKDCLIAHGAALLLKERFSSDRAKIPICQKCGIVAIEDRIKGKTYCPVCKKSKIVETEMAYAFKLMIDELKCMGILPKINTE